MWCGEGQKQNQHQFVGLSGRDIMGGFLGSSDSFKKTATTKIKQQRIRLSFQFMQRKDYEQNTKENIKIQLKKENDDDD